MPHSEPRMQGLIVAIFLSLFVAAIVTAPRLRAADLRVFAAASLTDSLQKVAAEWQAETHNRIIFNLGASSTLARQIEEGAPADVLFSADEAQMNRLEAKGLILQETRRSRLSNSLVIVVPSDNRPPVSSPKDLARPGVKRVALGDPKAVPIGIYAKQYLEHLNLWAAIAPKVVATENVRAALAAVEAGNADAAIVYKTDAAISEKVKIAFEVPVRDGPKISYPAAVIKESADQNTAVQFLDYLDSNGVAKVFRNFGFIVLPPSAKSQ
jgi:molybdate transport system substrate-binding protein